MDVWFKLYRERDARCLDYVQGFGYLLSLLKSVEIGAMTPSRAAALARQRDNILSSPAASGATLPAPRNPVPAFEAGRDGTGGVA